MVERLNVESVERMVGGAVVEDAARDWVYAMRLLASHAEPTVDAVGRSVSAWAAATADLVEALVDVEGGTDGLLTAEVLGVDVQDALGRALAASVTGAVV